MEQVAGERKLAGLRSPEYNQRSGSLRDHISVGGTIMEMGVWLFQEEENGLVNREFDQVVPDGQIYC